MSGGTIWLVAGLLLGAQELLAPGFFLLWIGLAAGATGALTAILDIGLTGQLATFAALAIALIALVAIRRRPVPDTINAPNAGLIGTTCYALDFQAGEGRVRLRDGTWQARLSDGGVPVINTPLRIVGLDGTTLLVTSTGPQTR